MFKIITELFKNPSTMGGYACSAANEPCPRHSSLNRNYDGPHGRRGGLPSRTTDLRPPINFGCSFAAPIHPCSIKIR